MYYFQKFELSHLYLSSEIFRISSHARVMQYFSDLIINNLKFHPTVNVQKEIQVTNSYLGLKQDVRECQNDEAFDKCTTRQYLDTILAECGCLPLSMRNSNKVCDPYSYFAKLIEQLHIKVRPN